MAKFTVMVSTNGRMETSTKENGSMVAKLAKVQTSMRMVMSLQGSMKMANHTVSAPTSGRMVLHTQASSEMASRMVSANGRKTGVQTVISMKASFGMI